MEFNFLSTLDAFLKQSIFIVYIVLPIIVFQTWLERNFQAQHASVSSQVFFVVLTLTMDFSIKDNLLQFS